MRKVSTLIEIEKDGTTIVINVSLYDERSIN